METETDETIYGIAIAAHTEAEALEVMEIIRELSKLLGPVYSTLFDASKEDVPTIKRATFMLLDLLGKLYSTGFQMGQDADSGYLEKYSDLLTNVKEICSRHQLQ